ncbi:hypothetical protein GEMRC1_004584 [Eukaryota sp. GEM-RC1]
MFQFFRKAIQEKERRSISIEDLQCVHPSLSLPNHAWMKLKLMYESGEVKDVNDIPSEIMKYAQHNPSTEFTELELTSSDQVIQFMNQRLAQIEDQVRDFRSSLILQLKADMANFMLCLHVSPPQRSVLPAGARLNFKATEDIVNSHLLNPN